MPLESTLHVTRETDVVTAGIRLADQYIHKPFAHAGLEAHLEPNTGPRGYPVFKESNAFASQFFQPGTQCRLKKLKTIRLRQTLAALAASARQPSPVCDSLASLGWRSQLLIEAGMLRRREEG